MKITRPDFYDSFKCIASACTDSCCIGWKIYIDEFTESIYDGITVSFGEKLRENIAHEEDGSAYFKMNGKRCPFLNENNLCDIFIELGENYLCDICTYHPRFFNYYGDLREEGLGLSCEEVARIMLTREDPIKFVNLEDDEEGDELDISVEELNNRLAKRDELIKTARNRELNIEDRMKALCADMPSDKEILEIYRSLESMEEKYPQLLNSAVEKLSDKKDLSTYEKDFEHILVYMLFRYYLEDNGEAWNGENNIRLAMSFTELCRLCYNAVLCEKGELTLADRIDIVKCLSKNIEYSDINIENLTEKLS
ncbi:MAG: flagellin lysine-N-methylase [Clostridia bacterium]|nr:flagellin lysine-N-methylase [Clostridia bacterium]